MSKACIFNDKKICDDCGDCDNCIFDNKKICNNCGKCLEEDGIDIRAIKIEEISINTEESSVPEKKSLDTSEESYDDNDDSVDDNFTIEEAEEYEDAWDHIEYMEEVQDILDDEMALEENSEEVYPGLIRIRRK